MVRGRWRAGQRSCGITHHCEKSLSPSESLRTGWQQRDLWQPIHQKDFPSEYADVCTIILPIFTNRARVPAHWNKSWHCPFQEAFWVQPGCLHPAEFCSAESLQTAPSPLPFPFPLPPPPIPLQSLLPRPILHSHKTDFCLWSSWQQQGLSTERWLRNKPTFPLAVRSF